MPTSDPPSRPAGRCPGLIAVALLLTAGLLAADLGLKYWAFNHWPDSPIDIAAVRNGSAYLPDKDTPVIPSVLAIRLTLNEGAVFGLGQGQRWFFIIISVAALGLIGLFFARSRADQRWLHLILVLILAGALGNLYDRMAHLAVRDMLWLFPGVHLPFGWSWPASLGAATDLYPWLFNLADVYLVVGIAVMLLRSFFGPRPTSSASQPGQSANSQGT